MTPVIVIVVAVVVVVVLLAVVGRRRRPPDGVDSFRRQLGALSAEARRPVTGRLRDTDSRPDPADRRDGDHGA